MPIETVPVGENFIINSYRNNTQVDSSISGLKDGSFAVVWQSEGQDGSETSIHGQIIAQDGNLLGGEFQVNTHADSFQKHPTVASLGNGGFVVLWESFGQDGSGYGVFGQRFEPNGQPVGAEFQVNTYISLDQNTPKVAEESSGGFIVVWESEGQDGSYSGIYGQRFNHEGSQIGEEFLVNTNTSSGQSDPSLAISSDGTFLVTWTDAWGDGSYSGVFAQLFDSDGSPAGTEFQVNTYTNSQQRNSSSTSLRDGDFLITWESLGQDGDETGIYAQILSSDGSFRGQEFQVNTVATGWQRFPAVTALTDGGFLISWQSHADGIYAQRYSSNGLEVGSEFPISTSIDYASNVSLGSLSNGEFMAAWNEYGDVFAQIFSSNTPPEGALLITGTVTQGETLMADASGVTDADGIDATTITYQWLRDGVAVQGATGESYALTQADVGGGISVVFTYTDDFATEENVVSDVTAPVENVNDAPEGALLITGTVTQGETLMADASGVTDADGIDATTITYQWLRDGVAVQGATGENYVLTQADVGGGISVVFTFTDDFGTEENVVSDVTAPVENVNDAPEGALLITGTVTQGETLMANASGVTDADGIDATTITYQWLRDGVAVQGATGESYALTQADVGGGISVVFTYTDDFGTEENVVSDVTDPVENVNDAPQGEVRVLGPIVENQIIFANITGLTDLDGILEDSFSFQWLKDGVSIEGGTSDEYVLTSDDVGAEIYVRVTYEDEWGGHEEVVSRASLPAVDSINRDGGYAAFGNGLFANSTTIGLQNLVDVASLPNGGFVAIWLSREDVSGTEQNLLGQFFDESGWPISDEIDLDASIQVSSTSATISVFDHGGFVVSWHGGEAQSQGVYLRVVDPTGHLVTEEIRVDTPPVSEGRSSNPIVDVLASGGYVVTWAASFADGETTEVTRYGVFAKVFDADHNPVGEQIQVNDRENTFQYSQDVAGLDDDDFVIVWVDKDRDGSNHGLFARIYDGEGNPTSSTFQVNTETAQGQYGAEIAVLEDGNFVVVWHSPEGNGFGVRCQIFDRTGIRVGTEISVNTTLDGQQYYPDITSLPDGGFYVSWGSVPQGGGTHDILGQRFDAIGQPVGDEIFVGNTNLSSSMGPQITNLLNGNTTILWPSYEGTERHLDVRGQIIIPNYDPDGEVVVSGEMEQEAVITAESTTVMDINGINSETITYQWLRDGVAIEGATGENYVLTQADVGGGISVVFTFTDDFGTEENVVSDVTAPVENVNDAPEGTVLIAGSATQGETLMADASAVTDADGIDATTITYQWLRDGVAVQGATGESYALTQADVGGGISVVFTYTDDFGTEENVVSSVTAPVVSHGLSLTGTPGDDDLQGNIGDDTIYGLDGNDRVIGDEGDDSLFGGDGNDTINGGDGDDIILGGETTDDIRDVIYAGAGNDRVEAGFGNDLVYGMDGDDTIAGGYGADELQGQDGDDVITGSAFGDHIFGGAGDDFVNGGFGADLINGGSGADRFYHEGDAGHGSDWVQDYMASEGDVLLFGFDFANASNFQVNFAHTENAQGERSGDDSIAEAFVIFRPTGQIMWALVDGAGQDEINLRISGSSEVYDLLG